MIERRKIKRGYRNKIQSFNGPYISARPVISKFSIDDTFKGLLIGTDGLWDELNNDNIKQIYLNNPQPEVFLNKLLFESLTHASKDANISLKELQSKKGSERRSFHDDISLLYINLQNQI